MIKLALFRHTDCEVLCDKNIYYNRMNTWIGFCSINFKNNIKSNILTTKAYTYCFTITYIRTDRRKKCYNINIQNIVVRMYLPKMSRSGGAGVLWDKVFTLICKRKLDFNFFKTANEVYFKESTDSYLSSLEPCILWENTNTTITLKSRI